MRDAELLGELLECFTLRPVADECERRPVDLRVDVLREDANDPIDFLLAGVTTHDHEPTARRRFRCKRIGLTGLVEDPLFDGARNHVNGHLNAAVPPVLLEPRAQADERVTVVVHLGGLRLDHRDEPILENALHRADVVERVRKHDVIHARHVQRVHAHERDAVLKPEVAPRIEQPARALDEHHVEVRVTEALERGLRRHREIETRMIAERNARKGDVIGRKLARLGIRVIGADDRDVDAARSHFPV